MPFVVLSRSVYLFVVFSVARYDFLKQFYDSFHLLGSGLKAAVIVFLMLMAAQAGVLPTFIKDLKGDPLFYASIFSILLCSAETLLLWVHRAPRPARVLLHEEQQPRGER